LGCTGRNCAHCARWAGGPGRRGRVEVSEVANGRNSIARNLASFHFEAEPGVSRIFRLLAGERSEETAEEPIKLLEVNENTIPVGIYPVWLPPDSGHGLHYPVIV